MPPLKHGIGARFGRMVITARNGYRITCMCDCGTEKTVHLANLTNGHIRSCGCLRTETTVARSTKHGSASRKGKTNTFTIWCDMRKRCTNPNSKSFKDYGERGIAVCDRWNDYANFLADMGERPPKMTLERKDNDKGYSPDNCIWASRAAQNRNKRNNHFITHNGKTQTLADWSQELGIHHVTIIRRLNRGGSVEESLKGGNRG